MRNFVFAEIKIESMRKIDANRFFLKRFFKWYRFNFSMVRSLVGLFLEDFVPLRSHWSMISFHDSFVTRKFHNSMISFVVRLMKRTNDDNDITQWLRNWSKYLFLSLTFWPWILDLNFKFLLHVYNNNFNDVI